MAGADLPACTAVLPGIRLPDGPTAADPEGKRRQGLESQAAGRSGADRWAYRTHSGISGGQLRPALRAAPLELQSALSGELRNRGKKHGPVAGPCPAIFPEGIGVSLWLSGDLGPQRSDEKVCADTDGLSGAAAAALPDHLRQIFSAAPRPLGLEHRYPLSERRRF